MRILSSPIWVKEILARNGDLIDLEFRCDPCFQRAKDGAYAYWYADYRQAMRSDLSTDYRTYCKSCESVLAEVEED